MSAPTRPVLRYHGGKWKLAPWLLSFFPPHRTYVELFGGGGSVLMRKPRSYAEVYNDLDGDTVNVFRVLRDPTAAARLAEQLRLTPFARDEWRDASVDGSADSVERARRTIARSFMGFGSDGATSDANTGFRLGAPRLGAFPAGEWPGIAESVPAFTARLRGVLIENNDAARVLAQHDHAETLFYVDPPYPMGTRSAQRGQYRHEMSDADHRAFAEALHGAAGMVVLSGYACELYDRALFAGWERHERAHLADGARDRVEVVWLNPACSAALAAFRPQASLFGDTEAA